MHFPPFFYSMFANFFKFKTVSVSKNCTSTLVLPLCRVNLIPCFSFPSAKVLSIVSFRREYNIFPSSVYLFSFARSKLPSHRCLAIILFFFCSLCIALNRGIFYILSCRSCILRIRLYSLLHIPMSCCWGRCNSRNIHHIQNHSCCIVRFFSRCACMVLYSCVPFSYVIFAIGAVTYPASATTFFGIHMFLHILTYIS